MAGHALTSGAPTQASHEREAAWVRQVAAGDRRAFEMLYVAYHPRLHRFAVAQGVPVGLEDEIVNDVMHVVWNRASSFDGTSRVGTWIFGISVNKIRAARRAYARSAGRWDGLETLDDHEAHEGSDVAAAHASSADLAQALAQLGPDHRAALELTYFEGLSYREIAQVMDCPENTVKTRVFHARKRLARALGTPQDTLGGDTE